MDVELDADGVLARHAAEHHGVFRGAHARMAGLSERQIVDRISDGRWDQIHRDVYRISGAPITWEATLLAACWAGGDRAVASHRSAAAIHLLPGGRRDLSEIMCPRWRRARHEALITHETKVLSRIDVEVVRGIAVTTPMRTLFDLGGVCRRGMVELALENALRRGLVDPDGRAGRSCGTCSRPGRPIADRPRARWRLS
jgi:hypothetical protein